jgi:PAS domain S-box-containing protein
MVIPDRKPNKVSSTHDGFKAVHEHSPMGVLAIGMDGTVNFANRSALAYTGLEEIELLGQPLFSLYIDPSPDGLNEKRIRGLEEITDQEFKVKAGPDERWVLLSSRVHRDKSGKVQTYIFVRDVSRLKKRERMFAYLNQAATTLANARDTSGALAQIAQFIVPKFADWFTIDRIKDNQLELLLLKHADPKKIEWAYQYRHKYPNDLTGNSGPALVIKTGKPGFVPIVTEEMILASVTDPVQREEVKKIGLHSVIIVPMTAGKKVTGLVNFISSEPGRHFDETDLEFAQNFASLIGLALENARLNEESAGEILQRRQGEEQLRFLTDAIPHKLWTSGPDGRATYYNRQWHDYTGIEGFETLRDRIWDFIHPDDRAAAALEWPAAVEKGEPMEMEHRLMRFDGVYRWHLSRFTAFKNGGGQVALWVGTSTDIHEQKISGMELAAANEELSATNEELTAMNEEVATTNEELIETKRNLEQSNASLTEREMRLKMAVDSTNLGTWDYDPLTGDLYWSEECRAIFGLPLGAAITFEAFSKQVHPGDSERVAREFQESIASNDSGRYDVTYRIFRFDNGDTRWIRVQGTAFFDSKGQAARFIGTILDITENKLAQEAIAKSEKMFRSISLSIPGSLIIVIDKDHRFISIEGDIMEKMGYDRRNYEGKHPTEIGPPERYEASRHLYERVMAGERFSVERKAATGEDYIVHFVPLKNEQGETDAGLIIALDITNIKQGEEKTARLAAIVQSSDDAIISKTLESVITSWNEGAERIFGYTAAEMIGESIYKLIPPDRLDEEPRIISRLKKGERVEHFETQRLTKHGSLLDVSLTISPVKDPQGNIIGVSKIARDITERKLDETRKNDFIGMVSHELKTPLTSLTAIIQIANAKLKESDNPFLSTAMERATIQVKKMTGMINGFLNISRLEAGKILIEKAPFRLDVLLGEIVEETRFIVHTHTISLAACGPVEINADREKISSVISNLISNAVKYSPKGRLVEINCHTNDKTVIVSIKDEGMGIKPQDLGQIFDRYYRVESNHTRHISGFGIGLYLSAEIIKRHEGSIWAESEIGKGATFYFNLPLINQ